MRDAHAGHWMLGTYVDNPPGEQPRLTLADVRDLSEAERDTFFRDRDLLMRITSASTILELARAFDAVREDARMVVATNGAPPDDRGQRRRDLDRFLSELTAFRNRVEKLADDHFGPVEAASLRKAFESAYKNQREYRLAWELRNTTLHGGNPMQGLNWRQTIGEPTRWTFLIDEVLDGRRNDRGWKAVADMWQPGEEVAVLQMCAMAYSWSEVTLAHAVVRNVALVDAALERRAALVAEVGEGDWAAVVFRAKWDGEGPGRALNTNIAFISDDHEAEALHAVAASREVVERWNATKARLQQGIIA